MTLPLSPSTSLSTNNGPKGGESHPGSPARPSQQQQYPNGSPARAGVLPVDTTRNIPPPPITTGLSRQSSGTITPLTQSSRPSLPSSALPSLPSARSAPSPARATPLSTPAHFPGQVDAVPGPSTFAQPSLERDAASRKRKWDTQGYTREEQEYLEQRSNELQLSLLLDQEETLHPSAAKFTSHEDMVNRLLPWHVWQIHDEELEVGLKSEGARGAAIEERERAEAAATVARVQRIHERFATVRRREGNPNRRSFDMLSLIKMTKDSTEFHRGDLVPLQMRLQGAENTYRNQQDAQRKAEAERRRVIEEEERRRFRAAEDVRKAAEAKAAREAKEAKEIAELRAAKAAKEKLDSAALATAAAKRVAAASAASASASPSSPSKGKATADVKGTPTRGRGRPRGRGSRGGTSLRETVLTHQSASTPSSPAPQTPIAPPRNGLPSAPTSPAAAGPSTPIPSITSRNPSPSKLGPSRNPSPSKAGLTSAPGTPRPNIPLSTPPIPGSKSPQAPITLAIKLVVLPQLIRLNLLAAPSPPPGAPPAAPYPAVIKGPVPNSPTGDVYLQVQLSLCSAQQLQGLAKALNIPVPVTAPKPPGTASNPGSPAPPPPPSATASPTKPEASVLATPPPLPPIPPGAAPGPSFPGANTAPP